MTTNSERAHMSLVAAPLEQIEGEIWKLVPGLEQYLSVSSLGRVMSLLRTVTKRHQSGAIMQQHYRERLLNPMPKPNGYVHVHIGINGVKRSLPIHRLVLEAFIGSCPEGMEGCHNNGKPSDNRLENLRWDTHLNNNRDRLRHGNYAVGEDHPMARLTEARALEIYRSDEAGCVLATRYGVSQTVISAIRTGNSWRDVTGGKPRPAMYGLNPRKTDKMSHERAAMAREMRASGASLKEIATEFGITQSSASVICAGKTWRRNEEVRG